MASTTNPSAGIRATSTGYASPILLCLALGLTGWAVAPTGWNWLALVAGIATAAAVAAFGRRGHQRWALIGRLTDALGPLLGAKQGPVSVRARRWRGWPGRPGLVQLRYAPSAADSDPGWVADVLAATSARLLGTYRVDKHDRARCRLTLRLRGPDGSVEESPAALRAERTIVDLIPTAKITNLELNDAGEVCLLEVKHQAGARLVPSGYRARVERSLSTMLPGRWRASWDMEGDYARFEQRPVLPESVWLPPLEQPKEDPLANYEQVEIPFAVDEDDNVVKWRPAISPHVLLVGSTGSGKTSTAHALLVRVAQYGWPIWVADGKSVEFLGFRDWPNVQVVASTVESQVAVVHRAWQVMEHRYQLITSGRAAVDDFEPLLVFLDEFTDFRGNLLTWYGRVKEKGAPREPLSLAETASLARKARTARVHMVMATQRADAAFVGGEMRDNFTMRISVGRISPQSATMMWDNPAVGTTLPRGRQGRAIAVNDAGVPVEVQCYRTPNPAKTLEGTPEAQLLAQVRPETGRQERLLIVPPERETDLDTGEVIEPTFTDFSTAPWVTAESRPDLDPLAAGPAQDLISGRELSSPMAIFGLASPALAGLTAAGPGPVEASAGGISPSPDLAADFDDGYASAATCSPDRAEVGDLVLVDADEERWAVVDEEPLPDVDDDNCVVVCWRDDNDEYGQLVVPVEGSVTLRHPSEE